MYTLYWSPGAVSMAARVVIEEVGAPYDAVRVEIDQQGRGEMLVSEDYLKINPKGRVPALVIGGEVLTETPAILQFLALRHPEADLLPGDALGQARCLEWMNWVATTLHSGAFSQIVRPQRFVSDAADYPAVIARGRQAVASAYAQIEGRLAGRQWAVGERYSIVDPYLLFFYLTSRNAGAPMSQAYPAWTAVSERVLARPATQRALDHQVAPA